MAEISPTEVFRNRNIFFIGGTGFLGKVTLSLLLDRFPEIGKIYLMVRAGSSMNSEERFWNNVFPSPAFDPLRKRYGNAVKEYLQSKLIIVGGDITHDNLGYSEEEAQRIANDIDLVLNSSGNVSFNPPLENALKTNVTGTQNLLAFAKRMKRPALVHTSTCFVAGNRSGQIWEDEDVIGYFPRKEKMKEVPFSVEQELKDCDRLIRSVVEEATDATLNAEFRTTARKRLIEEGRDPDDESTLRLAAARERKDWIRNRMSELGLQRALWWGWPNIYTYTKSMAEQIIAAEKGVISAIVRPAIVESSVQYPFPGWNEGFNTTAPLILFALNGQNIYPVNPKLILDIIPVDYVASALLAVAAQTCVEQPKLIYQLCSGDVNPNRLRRIVTLLGLYKRQHFQDKETGNRFLNALAARMEARVIDDNSFRKVFLPVQKKIGKVSDFLRRQKTYGTFSGLLERLRKGVDRAEAFTREALEAYEQFRPFTVKNEYYFRADNVRALFARIPEQDPAGLRWAPESIDWYHYWLKIHFPGLQKWVFPKMEAVGVPKPKRVYTYRNLVEMFDAITKLHADRVALRMKRNGQMEEYTYADIQELVLRGAGFLLAQGIQPEDRVGLMGENSPEWGISYFAIIKAGATCIPVDKDLSLDEIVNILRWGNARGLIATEKIFQKHKGLAKKLKEGGLDFPIWSIEEVYRLEEESVEQERIARLPKSAKPGAIASLIFTSGTTGVPKGVMLTHKNLTSMMGQLLKVYDVTHEDGFLSVLPLHHTFEFSTGFLLPFSKGARIEYLEELNGESISSALKNGHVTIMVGVPALWDLLSRRILNKFGEKSEKLEELVRALIHVNRWIREKTPLNLGGLLFFPVHHGLGGKIRYLISGGSALSEKVLETFYGLGFSLNEGYGLTEASPVLTVTRPGSKPKKGSVGEPLPGVEIRIQDPNEEGVGEVLARGPNIMAGYYQNQEATRGAIVDGWLHTGDLGYLDEEGHLFLVGRSKDIIVGPSGKNIYPDELEEIYRHHDLIKELSIVGLPQEEGEQVACLVVPDYDKEPSLSRQEVQTKIEEHFHTVSSRLPFYKRVKILEFTDRDLPRTGTRKVKRRQVVTLLQNQLARHKTLQPLELAVSGEYERLTHIVSHVCGKPPEMIHLHTTFDELGFDSLMYAELGAALEATGKKLSSFNALTTITTIQELADFLKVPPLPVAKRTAVASKKEKSRDQIRLPKIIGKIGSAGLDQVHRIFYEKYMRVEVRGKSNIPWHTNFIIAPNHASHLDTGLVKYALGDAGKNMAALAAADYFFDNKYKKAFFENFTNLIPMERIGSMHESLKLAVQALQDGFNLLIFPEGTRSATGRINDFKSSLGYLALRARKGILPIHLGGTFEAMPRGCHRIRKRNLSATIGPFLSWEDLDKLTEGMPKHDAYRMITVIVQKIVEQLRDGFTGRPDLDSIREAIRTSLPLVQEK